MLAAVLVAAAAAAQEPQHLELANGALTVRQDLSRGGAICHISQNPHGTNLVNIADEGRYIQQSYYAGQVVDRRAQGQGEAWSPWAWNPIQVGDYRRNRAKIVEASATDSTTYVKCIPMLWDMDNLPAEATMEQWTTLHGNTLHVRNRLACHRTDTIYGPARRASQEIPAVYPISTLCRLHAYTGNRPFTGDTVSELPVVQLKMNADGGGGTWGSYKHVPECWMAFATTDGATAMAVYTPSATKFLAGRAGTETDGTEHSTATSYIAPLRTESLGPDATMEYEYWIVVDSLPAVRTTIEAIHEQNDTNKR